MDSFARDVLAMCCMKERPAASDTSKVQASDKDSKITPKFKPLMSHETSVALIPPDVAWPPIQDARMLVQDKGLWRWPPHANLLYPFVAPSEFEVSVSPTIERLT